MDTTDAANTLVTLHPSHTTVGAVITDTRSGAEAIRAISMPTATEAVFSPLPTLSPSTSVEMQSQSLESSILNGKGRGPQAGSTSSPHDGIPAGSASPVVLAFEEVVYKSSGGIQLLHGVNGFVREGELLALLGPVGSGSASVLVCV